MIQGLSNTTLYAWQFAIRPRNKAVYFLCCNAAVYEKIPFQLVQSLWFSFLPLEQFKAKKKLSFSWLVVKKVNKFCSTKEHCLTLISCFLQCWCLVSMSVFQPHFKLCRLFVYAMHSRIINHIVYTTKKCFSPDARDMVARSIVANPIVIWISEQKLCRLCRWFSEEGIMRMSNFCRLCSSYSIVWLKYTWIHQGHQDININVQF